MSELSDDMNSNATIDISYGFIERAERQRRRLAFVVVGAIISAMLGFLINTYLLLLFAHQKSPLAGDKEIVILLLYVPCFFLMGLAFKKYLLLMKYNKKIKSLAELEMTICHEVLKRL